MRHTVIVSLLFALFFVLSSTAVIAEVPPQITYQGRLSGIDGQPVPDGLKTVRFMIWSDSLSNLAADLIWDSGPLEVTTKQGMFTVSLGAPPMVPLDGSIFEEGNRWLGVTVGTGAELVPRERLNSVPYSLQAGHAEAATTALTALSSLTAGYADASNHADWSNEVANSPGIAVGSGGDVSILADPYTVIAEVAFLSPNPGYVIASGQCTVKFVGSCTYLPDTLYYPLAAQACVGVDTVTSGTLPTTAHYACSQINNPEGFLPCLPTMAWAYPFYVSEVFNVEGGKLYTFRMLAYGRIEIGEGDVRALMPRIYVTYYPIAYGAIFKLVSGTDAAKFQKSEPVQVESPSAKDGNTSETLYRVDLRELWRSAKKEPSTTQNGDSPSRK